MAKVNQAPTPKQALQDWAKKNEVTPAEFAKVTSYSYQHAWNMLSGDTEPTYETLGRLVIAYGYESVASIVKSFTAPSQVVVRGLVQDS